MERFCELGRQFYSAREPHYRGLGWTQLKWMFGGKSTDFYMPLTWVTYGLDYTLWGMNPAGYHLTSLVLHALNACVFYFVALRLLLLARGSTPAGEVTLRAGAALAALLFSLHPLRVESVVWATERRDVLSGLFYLLAILAYLRCLDPDVARRPRGRAWYWGAVAAGLAALLSKPMAVSLPVILVLLDFYPLKRLGVAPNSWLAPAARRVWLEKLPFILLSAATSALTLRAVGALNELLTRDDPTVLPPTSWPGRLAVSAYALAFYLWKTVLPWNLSTLYEQPVPLDPTAWPFMVSAAVVLAVSIVALVVSRRWPALLTVWVAYVAVLLPVLGIVGVQTLIAADRYTYLACLGWTLLAGGLLVSAVELHAAGRLGRRTMTLVAPAVLAVPIVLGALAWTQARVWRNSETLWAHTVAVTPSARAQFNWGVYLRNEGRSAEAVPHLREAVRLRSEYPAAHHQLGAALATNGELEAAVDEYREALRTAPRAANVHVDLGVALRSLGETTEAAAHFREALRLYPGYARAHFNLALILAAQSRWDDAVEHFRQGLRADPRNPDMENNLGILLVQLGRPDEASHHFRRAVDLDPSNVDARNNLGAAFAKQGRLADAIDQYEAALRGQPAFAEAHLNLGITLARAGRLQEAVGHFQTALEINPWNAQAHDLLGIALAQQGQFRQAAAHFREAVKINPNFGQARVHLEQAVAAEGQQSR